MKGGQRWSTKVYLSISLFITLTLTSEHVITAAELAPAAPASDKAVSDQTKVYEERKELFEQIAAISGIPWNYLAAIDQYERTLNAALKRPAKKDGLISIYIAESDWAGILNPDQQDTNPQSIAMFRGLGKDGSGDGLADRNQALDVIAAITAVVTKHGLSLENFRLGLWEYYQNSRSVQRIDQFARVYLAFGTLDLQDHAFPLPLRADYSYRSTWGASRGWGGFRIHEGTDLFANHGVPVRSASYGIIEIKGWNPYGGWRIGIRDLNNVYHYFAHLSGFSKELKVGDVVKPGQTVGWVGSSGYGKPGTSGKFPPHLHYGLYRDNGLSEWSFDPYPYLRKWEREEAKRAKK
jgi:murein DD-endopeptidase MepM/ murein hydrolase activator NlpD